MQWNICEKFEGFQYLPYKFQRPPKMDENGQELFLHILAFFRAFFDS